jgi:hypothetical protein
MPDEIRRICEVKPNPEGVELLQKEKLTNLLLPY